MPRVYWSTDDGALYLEEHIDDPSDTEHFEVYEIPNTVTLTVEEIAQGVPDILEVLLRAGKAVKV